MFFSRNTIPEPVPPIFATEQQNNFEVINTTILTNDNTVELVDQFVVKEEVATVEEEQCEEEECEEEEECNKEEECEEEECEEEDDENTIYVISYDDTPYTYEKELSSAKNRIELMAKKYNLNDVYGYHSSYIKYKNELEINIIRNYDFGFFSYNYVIHTFTIHRINKN